MLSEMFKFAGPGTAPAAQVIAGSYRIAGESFLGHRQGNPMAAEAVMQLSSTHASSVVTSAPHLHHQAFPGPAFSDEAPFSGGKGGLSLTLASSLHEFEMVKVEDLRLKNEMLFFDDNNHDNNYHQRQGQRGDQHPASSMGMASSRYARAARGLLEELCSLGRGRMESSRNRREHHHECEYGDPEQKDVALLAPADRAEHQRRKAKLLSMLDEVERRYNHYCEQMQAVVTSFDAVMGFGAATPYTRLAQKAMSRHFRCLRDAVVEQLRQTCELLGDREGGGGGGRRSAAGITKGETPRLKLLDRSLRQRRAASSALGRMGIMEQDAWRPQRGLPERSVGILRAWLFEHFLHPYPSDADKHLLARQAGLSRNQVSNWFINARVRLWKPMVEEMYQQDAMAEEHEERTPPPPPPLPPLLQHDIHNHGFTATSQNSDDAVLSGELGGPDDDDLFRIAEYGVAGNVSLTLGLRHGSNPLMKPEKEPVFF